VKIFSFSQSRADILELTLPADSRVAGTRVGQVIWPADVTLSTIVRDGRPLVPSPDDTLEAGDELLLVAGSDADTDALQKLLVPKG
jgi:trk system potassium uptake protein TrkA